MAGKQAKLRAKERRKQKPYDKKTQDPAALGERALYSAGEDANKADDELELEAFLFGRKKKSARKAPVALPGAAGEPAQAVEESALGHLADQEVRDDPPALPPSAAER